MIIRHWPVGFLSVILSLSSVCEGMCAGVCMGCAGMCCAGELCGQVRESSAGACAGGFESPRAAREAGKPETPREGRVNGFPFIRPTQGANDTGGGSKSSSRHAPHRGAALTAAAA